MKFIDAHVHLSDADYSGKIEEIIADAKSSGISALVTNSLDLKTCQNDVKLSDQYPGLVYPALGIHPWNVNGLKETELQDTIDYIESHRDNVVAIGEIGLDYKYESTWEQQVAVFNKMLHLAESLRLPVIIHSRGTTDKIVEMLPSYRLTRVLLHWFSHPIETLRKAIDKGYCITEGPPVSYSNGIREVIENTPLANILTETDGPVTYWKKPYNGQLTKPSYIRHVVEAIAKIKGIPLKDVSDQIAENFETFFDIKLN
jgi:TatD DNase family protein